MKNILNRGLSALLALALCLSLWVVAPAPEADAAGTVEYRYGSTSEYSNCSNVIYNWGSRGTVATFLSPNAEKFYEDNNTSYAALSALKGSSTESSVPSSALFTKLRTLMTSNHTYETSYNATRDMFAFTDCQNSALTSTKISSFYSGSQIGPGWDGGSTWNREHTWPNSKGDANGNGENDIMMLRPASSSENSGRNNTAYGESSSYYNPNKASGDTYDLRGDVARIVLYVYVRWQDTGSSAAVLFGTDGVIESKEVLLKWMTEDPVDTWELGRNDSVESITGTRNVFVDYPELGFLLFGTSVPADYQSPSNNSGDSGDTETVTVSFMENGKQTLSYSVTTGQSIEIPAASVTPDSGYSFAGWVTNVVEETAAKPANIYLPGSTVAAAEQTYYALYTRVDTSTGSGNIYKLHTGNITEGDYIITYTDSTGTGAMEATLSSNRFAYQTITVADHMIVGPDDAIVWHIAPNGDYFTIYNSGYAAASYTNNQVLFLNYVTDYCKWSISGTEVYDFVNLGNSKYLRKNSTYGFSAYAQSTGGSLTLYKAATGTSYYSTVFGDVCAHVNTSTNTVNATCTENGSITVTCNSCGEVLSTSVITATGHSYSSVVTAPTATQQGYTTYTCSKCGDSYVGNYVPALGQSYTVSFSVPAGVSPVSSMTGNTTGITLPTAGEPDGYTFAGWTTHALEETTEAPVILTGTYIPTENTKLYALYTRKEISGQGSGDYEKVTAAPSDWTGDYVIVYEDGNCVFDSTLTKLDAANNYKTVTITNNAIAASEAEPYKFTIEEVSGGYSIRSASGYYIGATGNSNSLNSSTSTAYANTLSVNEDGTVNVIGSGGAYLRYNSASNQLRFRYYKSSTYTGQKAICLYKKSSGSTTTYYATLTANAQPVASVNGVEYADFAEAYAAADGQTVKLLNTIGEGEPITLNMTHDLYIDLNGWYLYADVTANGYTVYGKDSNTDTYDSEDYGALVLTGATVAAQDGYLAYHAADTISFHAYELKLLAVSLDAANDALGYKAQFFGDEVVCSMVTGFGFNMGVQLQKTYTKAGTLTNGQIFTLRLKNILACNGGEMDITASAFVSFGETTKTTDPHSTTMRATVEAVNDNWDSYTDDQRAAVLDLYAKHSAVIDGWLGENNNIA